MTKEELNEVLISITARKIDRNKAADIVLLQPDLFESLLHMVFDVKNKDSIKAAWVFELVCMERLDLLAPHLDYFTSQLKFVVLDSAVRPISKICEFIAKACQAKKTSLIKASINQIHIDSIIETSFDWLISEHRVAVKVYAMSTLYLFGKDSDWIHEELRLILTKDMVQNSPAYSARGKKFLALINANN